MGRYTSIALFCCLAEDCVDMDLPTERPANFDLINSFIENHDDTESLSIVDVPGHWHCAALFIRCNPWLDDLKDYILKLPWIYPEEMNLLWREEDGKSEVYSVSDKGDENV